MVKLRENPFFLDDEGEAWVASTLASLTLPEKVGQIFCPVGFTDKEEHLLPLVKQMGIGGIMYRPGKGADLQKTHRLLQDNSKVPMLIAANLEAGGSGAAQDGTTLGKPMQVAAAADPKMGYHLGKISCAEGQAVGVNWAFAPIVDIDMNFRNPITNLRTFGSDVETVINMAKGYMKAADECGSAVSIKHFPGDGVDERDQHLLTSINSLSVEEYDATCGRVYKELIDAGAKTVMVGHIAQPAYAKKLNPALTPEEVHMPASLSPDLLNGLLRGKLGFNGLICSDATPMMGFTTAMPRKQAVPRCIAAGCDVFLFNKNLPEDFGWMMAGIQSGVVTMERLDEAVTRVLATKASLGLHKKQKEGTLVPGPEALSILNCTEFQEITKQCADRAVTLVKDTAHLLPLSPTKHKRVLLNVLEPSDAMDSTLRTTWKSMLEKEGFTVTVRDRDVNVDMEAFMAGKPEPKAAKLMGEMMQSVTEYAAQYDLMLYVSNYETASNNTVIRIGWKGIMGMSNDSPWATAEIPTLFVSLANPYHLLDVPMMKTFINAYTNTPDVNAAVMEKLMGRSQFTGVSPVDPFCGRTDLAF